MRLLQVTKIFLMKKKGKIILLTVLLVILLLIVSFLAFIKMTFGDELKAISTIKKLDDGPYYMEWKGEYGFDEFLAHGGAETDSNMAEYIVSFLTKGFYKPSIEEKDNAYGCSALTDGPIFGRNFDWVDSPVMIVKSEPKNGFASYSTVCLEFLGFDDNWTPDGSIMDKFMALAAVYVPLDGMNEEGLCIADLLVINTPETHQKTDKPDLTTVGALRMILDHASTVDEAVALLEKIDMNSSIGSNHHYAISDRSGKSVAVEWIGNKMYVTETKAVTNNIVKEELSLGTGNEESWKRYYMLLDLAPMINRDYENMKDAMERASYENETLWSVVYDKEKLNLSFYLKRNFDAPLSFSL